MLSQEEIKEISEDWGHYEKKSAACIEALRVVQRYRGWVSDQAILDIAALLEMTSAEVDAVATFYNLIFRRPVGKQVIFVCDSVSCWVMGSDRIQAQLAKRLKVGLGETTSDGAFTVLPIACLGRCEHAPVLWVDGEPVLGVTPQVVEELLGRPVLGKGTS